MKSIPSEGEVRSKVIRWDFACMFETLCEVQSEEVQGQEKEARPQWACTGVGRALDGKWEASVSV